MLGHEAVQRPLFSYVILLVHQLGGTHHSYITDIVQFGETMVDSKQRRCQYHLYKVACAMPVTAPDCKVAMIKKQYSLAPDASRCVPNPPDKWITVRPDWLEQLEVMLRHLKLEGTRSALAANIPPETEKKAAERQLRIRGAEMNLMVVTAFEDIAFKKKETCNATVVQNALVDAAREVFVKYEAVTLVPPPPQDNF